jgi:hypothetical protein
MRTAVLIAAALTLGACGATKMVSNDCPEDRNPAGMVAGVEPPSDDGFNTYLRFPGRMQIPAITVKDQLGVERAVDRTTNPDTGEVVLHGVFPVIVLRNGPNTACFVNKAYDPVGRRPVS